MWRAADHRAEDTCFFVGLAGRTPDVPPTAPRAPVDLLTSGASPSAIQVSARTEPRR